MALGLDVAAADARAQQATVAAAELREECLTPADVVAAAGSALAPNRTALAPILLIDELVRCGVRDACVSPGSRSAPLASALVAHGGIALWSHVDERSGGFFALGLARAARRPVAIVCTSGTAVANLFPAVVEAFHARLPLLVLTADRPPELRDCAAGQTIDQSAIFGSHVRWFFDLGTPEPTADAMRHVRVVACRAVAIACGDGGAPPGPVHLNLPFREPLDPRLVPADVAAIATLARTPVGRGRAGAAWTRSGRSRPAPDYAVLEEIAGVLQAARRPLVVAGPLDEHDPSLAPAVAGLCAALRAPLLAEVASNLRRGTTATFVVDAHDALVRAAAFTDRDALPDAIVRIGAPPTSKALATWLAALDEVPLVLVDPAGAWPDPASLATYVVAGAPAAVCASLAVRLGARRACGVEPRPAGDAWLARWQAAGVRARQGIEASIACAAGVDDGERAADTAASARADGVFEAHAVVALARALPAETILYVGNSLAVRALDAFWPPDGPPLRVLLNRGANGIDGFVSSVLGAAAADRSRPVVGLCGDLSFYHDLNGLLAARRHGIAATFVVLNNDGGGIFDHLPIASHPAGYEQLFATPHGLDFQPVVEMYGCAFARVATGAELALAVGRARGSRRTSVIELRFDRRASLAAWNETRVRAARAADAEPMTTATTAPLQGDGDGEHERACAPAERSA